MPGSIGLRLPTWGEAVLLVVNHDVPGVGQGDRFWTDEIASTYSQPSSGLGVMTVDESGGGLNHADTFFSHETVCVTNPD